MKHNIYDFKLHGMDRRQRQDAASTLWSYLQSRNKYIKLYEKDNNDFEFNLHMINYYKLKAFTYLECLMEMFR